MLIAIHHKGEGEAIRAALLTIWWTRTFSCDGVRLLRGIGAAIMLPLPTFFQYEDWCTRALMRGMRLPRFGFTLGFVRGDKRKPTFRARAMLEPALRQALIATREQIEDGLYPVRSTTKGEANVSQD